MANTSDSNVRIVKTLEGSATTYATGDTVKYILTVDNRQGTYEALNVVPVDTLPKGLTYNGTEISYDGGTTWTSLSGVTSSINGTTGVTTITLPALRRLDNDGKVWGGTNAIATQLGTQDVKYRLSTTVDGTVFGSVTNSATVTNGSGEAVANQADNTSTRAVTLQAQPQLTLTKTIAGAGRINAADQFTVQIRNGATVTASASTTGTGTSVSTTQQTLAAGTTYTLTEVMAGGSVSALSAYATTISCTNTNTGSTTVLPTGSGQSFSITPSGNDVIACTLTNTPTADLSTTNDDGVTSVTTGTATTYTVRVTNAGPAAVTAAVLRDPASTGLTKTTVVCSAAAGNVCTVTPPTITALESGAGFTLPTLAVNGFYEILVTSTVTAAAGSNVTNTASVTAPNTVIETNTTNNSRDDTDSVAALGNDLSITLAGTTQAVVGGQVGYVLTITNSGSTTASNVVINDIFPSLQNVIWDCLALGTGSSCGTPARATGATSPISTTVSVAPGAANSIRLFIQGTATATGTLTNNATVTSAGDPNTSNNTATPLSTQVSAFPAICSVYTLSANAGVSTTWPLNSAVTVTPALSTAAGTPGSVSTTSFAAVPSVVLTPGINIRTTGGNTVYTLTFSSPVPANQVFFSINDLNVGPGSATVSVTGTATLSNLNPILLSGQTESSSGPTIRPLVLDTATGTIYRQVTTAELNLNVDPTTVRGSLNFLGTGTQTISSLSITTSNVNGGDLLAFSAGAQLPCDAGDAPVSYGDAEAGAASALLRIGALLDSETGVATPRNTTGDDVTGVDDEDALSGTVYIFGNKAYAPSLSVLNNTGRAATLYGWIDFDNNGSFSAGEGVSVAVPSGASAQPRTLSWSVPASVTSGTRVLRLRLSTDGSVTTSTPAARAYDGETEDHTVTVGVINPELIKRVRNVTTATAFSTTSAGKPNDVLEYCVTFNNVGSNIALPNFRVLDDAPAQMVPELAGYGGAGSTSAGIRLIRGGTAAAGSTTVTGGTTTTLYSDGSDSKGGSLTTSGGTFGAGVMNVLLTSPLQPGEAGQVCFQAKIK